MPIYEYICATCGKRYERIQHISEDPDTRCVSCAGPVQRVIYAPQYVSVNGGTPKHYA